MKSIADEAEQGLRHREKIIEESVRRHEWEGGILKEGRRDKRLRLRTMTWSEAGTLAEVHAEVEKYEKGQAAEARKHIWSEEERLVEAEERQAAEVRKDIWSEEGKVVEAARNMTSGARQEKW